MCGIVMVAGPDAGDMAVSGLKRLQYRGYDSYGFGWVHKGKLDSQRSTDPLDELVAGLPATNLIVGHTRWATHGQVTLANAHPHLSADGRMALVHNGIVENVAQLSGLVKTPLLGQTDSEVVMRLIEAEIANGADVETGLAATFARLNGRNALLLLCDDGRILGIKRGSPLVAGRSPTHHFLGSDVLSFSPWATEHQMVADNSLFGISSDGVVTGLGDDWNTSDVFDKKKKKEGHPHFMAKEILEQWQTIPRQFNLAQPGFDQFVGLLLEQPKLLVVGAGGAAITAGHISYTLRQCAGLDAIDVPAYEIESYLEPLQAADVTQTLMLAISQSGETADTLAAVELAREKGIKIASLVNMPHTTLASLSDFAFANGSGPEVCVLSTKSASAQMAFGVRLAAALMTCEHTLPTAEYCSELSRYLETRTLDRIHRIAVSLSTTKSLYVLGHGGHYWSAKMAALNIKEASYIHAEAFATGELKHGVIAMIEKGTPVLVFDDGVLTDNAIAEVQARGASVIAVSNRQIPGVDLYLPTIGTGGMTDAASSIIAGQVLAYHLGVLRGVNPDRPRNLAKSVTVR